MAVRDRAKVIETNTPPSDRVKTRFWSHVEKQEHCWVWTSTVHKRGYGVFWLDGGNISAHRLSYSWFKGPIDPGDEIDHVCHNKDKSCPGGNACLHRRCVNPDHLEAVSPVVNRSRGITSRPNNGKHWSDRTHCKNGHEFTVENTHIRTVNGKFRKRDCRACNRERYTKIV